MSSSVCIASAQAYRVGALAGDVQLAYQCSSRWTAMPPAHDIIRSSQRGNDSDGMRAAQAHSCTEIMHGGWQQRQAKQGARKITHRDQHSTIQMDGLEDDTFDPDDTHHSVQSLSGSGRRPFARLSLAPPGQRCAVRQRIQRWQLCDARTESWPFLSMEWPLLRRQSIEMILAFT